MANGTNRSGKRGQATINSGSSIRPTVKQRLFDLPDYTSLPMPQFVGSDKQISWAKSIWINMLYGINDALRDGQNPYAYYNPNNFPTEASLLEAADQLANTMLTSDRVKSAAFMIDNRGIFGRTSTRNSVVDLAREIDKSKNRSRA